ncbi:hypothetical protein [Terrimonas ferruginea]|nr:hypothetical protein [Terrimonas ferruginea]
MPKLAPVSDNPVATAPGSRKKKDRFLPTCFPRGLCIKGVKGLL